MIVVGHMELSKNGKKLIELYTYMAKNGYYRTDGIKVESKEAYNQFQIEKFKDELLPSFKKLKIKTLLDYGGGGSNWDALNFDEKTGISAKEFFELQQVKTFEPARNKTDKVKSDCVVCMDVLEHIFLADVSAVVRELFSLTNKLLIINVACYEANALLPTGENAHITIREPAWWSGLITTIADEFPEVEVLLLCSENFLSGRIYKNINSQEWHNSEKFTINECFERFGETPSKTKDTSSGTMTGQQILNLVDALTQSHPETVPEIQKVLRKNAPFLNFN